MISFNAITKRNDFFIATPIKDYVLTLTNIDIINVNHNLKKNTLTLKINENSDKKVLSIIENISKEVVIHNNDKWFKNNLDQQDIIDNYYPCFNEQNNTLDVILHSDYLPKLEGYNSIKDISEKTDCLQNITIKLIGIYIKNNSFYIRWLVRNIEKLASVNEIDDIEELFDTKYERLIQKIDNKISILNNYKTDLRKIYANKDFEALTKSFYLILDKI
jgi:hypothetical protein|tara:strand:+ start:3357 stop:4010 length:654 start_codon:yes stop_codon:yes gene_type:complete